MPIIDSQVHAYERDHPGRPWVGTLVGPAEVTGDQMAAAMDEVGVRRRAMERQLRAVEVLPEAEAAALLEYDGTSDEEVRAAAE